MLIRSGYGRLALTLTAPRRHGRPSPLPSKELGSKILDEVEVADEVNSIVQDMMSAVKIVIMMGRTDIQGRKRSSLCHAPPRLVLFPAGHVQLDPDHAFGETIHFARVAAEAGASVVSGGRRPRIRLGLFDRR